MYSISPKERGNNKKKLISRLGEPIDINNGRARWINYKYK